MRDKSQCKRRDGVRGEEGGRKKRQEEEWIYEERRGERTARVTFRKHAEVCPADETVVNIQNEALQEILQLFHQISYTNCAS